MEALMRHRLYLCAAALLASTAAAAQSNTGCTQDQNPSSMEAGCATDGLPAVSKPLPAGPSALERGRLDQGTTSSVTDDALPNMPPLEVPSHNPGTDNDDDLTGSSGSAVTDTGGNADVSGSTSTNRRVGGSAITGTSGVSSQ